MYKNSGYKLYVVSNNYNPLGNAFLFCPPGDWRRPDYVDTYNNILEAVAKRNGVPYIDNNYEISGVAWDSASDWCHYDFKVMKAVISYDHLAKMLYFSKNKIFLKQCMTVIYGYHSILLLVKQ